MDSLARTGVSTDGLGVRLARISIRNRTREKDI